MIDPQGMGGFNGGDGRTNFVRHSISAAHNRLWQGDRRYIYDDGVNSTSPGRNQTSTIAYTSIIPTGEKSFAVVYNMDRGGHWSGGSSAAFIMHAKVTTASPLKSDDGSASSEPTVLPLTSAAGQRWTLSGSGPIGAVNAEALVPGDVTHDMQRQGRLNTRNESLWYADNARETPWWVVLTEWTYATAVPVPAVTGSDGAPGANARAALRFDGVDYNCSVYLNGVSLGRHLGSFVGFELDATKVFAQAANNGLATIELRVVLHVPPNYTDFSVTSIYNGSKEFPLQMYGTEKCAQNRLFTMWKGQMNRWDFAPPYWQVRVPCGLSPATHMTSP